MRYHTICLSIIFCILAVGCGSQISREDAEKEFEKTVAKFDPSLSTCVHYIIQSVNQGQGWGDNDAEMYKHNFTLESRKSYLKYRAAINAIPHPAEVKNQAKQNKIKKPSKSIFD